MRRSNDLSDSEAGCIAGLAGMLGCGGVLIAVLLKIGLVAAGIYLIIQVAQYIGTL